MTAQLPEGAAGPAALSLVVAFVSITCSSLVIWLTWSHKEWYTHVAILSYFCLLSTIASVIQQIHDIVWWRDVQTASHEVKINDSQNPDLRLAYGSTGMDLILYYIQFYCYQVMSLIILSWASELAQSVYGLTHKTSMRKILRKANRANKIISLVLPVIVIIMLRLPAIRASELTFTVVTDVPFGVGTGVGSILMLLILGRYLYSRRKLLTFDAGNGVSTDPETTSSNSGSRISKVTKPPRRKAVYDRWLVTRFSIAFFFLALFQATATLFQQLGKKNFRQDDLETGLGVQNAVTTFVLFIPGNLPGIGVFIIFGTTAAFRKQMYKTFVPRRLQRNRDMLFDQLPSPRMGPVVQMPSVGDDHFNKELPGHRGSTVSNIELSPLHESHTIEERGSVFVISRLPPRDTRSGQGRTMNRMDSSDDSTPTLVIMQQSDDEHRKG